MTERAHVVVIKIGSNSLVNTQGRLDVGYLDTVAKQLAAIKNSGHQPVLVSSGAVASGMGILKLPARPPGLPDRQALAAIGQATLAHRWEVALAAHGLIAAQLLLTYTDFTIRERYLNLTATLRSLFAYKVIPVINENDPVAVQELTVGDNDRLSALMASQLGAEHLILLTDIDGVYDADPRLSKQAQRLEELVTVTQNHIDNAGGASELGRGGMRSKLEAARLASGAGVMTTIAMAREARVIERIVAGEAVGTRILAKKGERADGRRRWLAVARSVRGHIHIDAGAVKAITHQQRSLLPAGITHVTGKFDRGDTISIQAPDGEEIARGLVGLSSTELEQICGKRLNTAAQILGYVLPKTAVHRDNMLVLRHH